MFELLRLVFVILLLRLSLVAVLVVGAVVAVVVTAVADAVVVAVLVWTQPLLALRGGGGGFIVPNFVLICGFVICAVIGLTAVVAISLCDFEIVKLVVGFCALNLEKFSLDAEECSLLELRVDNWGVELQEIAVVVFMFRGSVFMVAVSSKFLLAGIFVFVVIVVVVVFGIFVSVGGLLLTLVLGDKEEVHLKVDEEDEVEGDE